MTSEGMLEPEDIFKTATGDVWYVDSVTSSGAYCIHLSAHPTPITTRKRETKIVNRHLPNAVFSRLSLVDLVPKDKLDLLQLRRRIAMARKDAAPETEGAVAEAPAAESRPAPAPRAATKYVRTDKALTKELRGQSKEVMDAFNAANGEAKTAQEIANVCVFAGSRQDKLRVASFYIAQFKKDGFIKVAEVPATPAPEPVGATA